MPGCHPELSKQKEALPPPAAAICVAVADVAVADVAAVANVAAALIVHHNCEAASPLCVAFFPGIAEVSL